MNYEQELMQIATELRMTMPDEEKRALLMRYYEANAGRAGLQRRIQSALDELLLRTADGRMS
jgi:hypothetical protein